MTQLCYIHQFQEIQVISNVFDMPDSSFTTFESLFISLNFVTQLCPEPFLSALQKVIFFFVRLQIFLHAGCNFLHPAELAPHANKDECCYWCLQIWSRILHNWHFLKNFVQIPKNNSG